MRPAGSAPADERGGGASQGGGREALPRHARGQVDRLAEHVTEPHRDEQGAAGVRIAPSDSNILYASYYGFIWRSADGGRTVRRTALPVGAGYIAATVGYGLAYIAGLLVLSVLIFSRRDFK